MSNSRPHIRAVTLAASTTSGAIAASYFHGYSVIEDGGTAALWSFKNALAAQIVGYANPTPNRGETVMFADPVELTLGTNAAPGGLFATEDDGSLTTIVYVSGWGAAK